MKKVLMFLPSLLLAITASAQSTPGSAVPEAATRDFAGRYPAITPKKWKQDKEGQYVAVFQQGRNASDAFYDKGGNWVKTETHIKWTKNLPPAVKEGFDKSKYISWYVEHMQETDSAGQKRFYIAVSLANTHEEGGLIKDLYRLTFTPEGDLLRSEKID